MDPKDYNPAEDENQGVMTKLARAEEANDGVSQVERMNPVRNQGPEPIKEEIGDNDSDANATGVNNAMLAEEAVEDGDVEMDNEDPETGNVDVEYEDGDN